MEQCKCGGRMRESRYEVNTPEGKAKLIVEHKVDGAIKVEVQQCQACGRRRMIFRSEDRVIAVRG